MKTVEEIYEEMMAVFRRETGAEGTAASDLSVKLYAVAARTMASTAFRSATSAWKAMAARPRARRSRTSSPAASRLSR